MKSRSFQSILIFVVTAVLSLVILWVVAGQLAQVTAQEANGSDDLWNSSAEAPAGTSPAQYSPADNTASLNRDDVLDGPNAPDALISWRVTGSALKPREDDVSYTINSSGSCGYVSAGDASTVWHITPVLPQGAVVDTLRMYYYDTSNSNSSAWFTIYDLYGTIVDEFSVSSVGNSGNSFNDSVQINHTVDYSVYSYLLNWRPGVTGSTMQLCGFRIFYTPPFFTAGFLPAVVKD